MSKRYKNYILNLVLPVFIFGAITGVLTSVIILAYKYCAKHVIHFSELGYDYVREHLYLLTAVLPGIIVVAIVLYIVYKKYPDLKGGGIPSSVAILRGLVTFKWLRVLIGTFVLSLGSFLIGVPLGTEGPAVQMGTAVGRASLNTAGKKHRVWDRYLMTGGACAGFSAATGAPISGIMFAVEEAHQRISPMIILISSVSIIFCSITTELLAPVMGVSVALFPELAVLALTPKDIWIPIVIGVAMGLFAVIFLNYYRLINGLLNKKLSKVKNLYKILLILGLTVTLGLFSFKFISTGHELILELFEGGSAIYLLVLVLLARSTLTVASNSGGITGGIFLPMLAIGGVLSAIIGELLTRYMGLGSEYYTVVLVLGITACISGMMKMPLTAIVFAIEALSCYNNIFYVIAVSAVAFVITEIFSTKSINDSVLESRVEAQNADKEHMVIDTFVTVKSGSFAIGKQIRDILWPANLFVLSFVHRERSDAEVDEHGGKELRESDVLHIRYLTYDEPASREAIISIVGEQDYDEQATDVI